jgi:hypothetical protein
MINRPAAHGNPDSPSLVDKDQAPGIKPALILLPLLAPPGDLRPQLLDGEQRFFLKRSPSERTNRHTDTVLVAIPCSASSATSALSVMSGTAFTRPITNARCGSSRRLR